MVKIFKLQIFILLLNCQCMISASEQKEDGLENFVSINQVKEEDVLLSVEDCTQKILVDGIYGQYLKYKTEYLGPLSQEELAQLEKIHNDGLSNTHGIVRQKPNENFKNKRIPRPIAELFVALERQRCTLKKSISIK